MKIMIQRPVEVFKKLKRLKRMLMAKK